MAMSELYLGLMAAHVRSDPKAALPDDLRKKPLSDLTEADLETIYRAGKAADLKLYRFKKTHEDLPRIRKVLGFLRGIDFDSLLDIGSGRGAFLLPLLSTFPWVHVTSADILPHRVEFLQSLTAGGVDRLTAVKANICDQPFPTNSFDVVTLLEVLEHIPDVDRAVAAAVSMARRFVVVSVPSHPDNNPEHIHLLTKERLTALFQAAGCHKLNFDGVNGHLILIATISHD